MFAFTTRTLAYCKVNCDSVLNDEHKLGKTPPTNEKLTNISFILDLIAGITLVGLVAINKNKYSSSLKTMMVLAGNLEIGAVFGAAVLRYNYQ